MIERAIRREVVGLKPRQRMPRDVRLHQYFGITADERQDCEAWLRDRLPDPVPRSACVFCPYRTNKEWLHLKKTDPEGWDRAVEIDHALRREGTLANRKTKQKLYLHRSCLPLDWWIWTTRRRCSGP